jgi:hypothetical protein
VSEGSKENLRAISDSFGVKVVPHERFENIEFQYDHALGPPRLFPDPRTIKPLVGENITASHALCFGLIECEPIVHAEMLVYDPQAGNLAKPPSRLGHTATRMAIVANLQEVAAMLGRVLSHESEPGLSQSLGEAIRLQEGCEVVVVKNGVEGAAVVTGGGTSLVPSYLTDMVFPIGSGDVFSGTFAAFWMEQSKDPHEAARLASGATAYYCNSSTLPIPRDLEPIIHGMSIAPVASALAAKRRIYLAGPLFTLPQTWLLNEAKRHLEAQGLLVFSPKDEVGYLGEGQDARIVAQADIAGLESSDLVFAILDGLDPGTLFEVGYARKLGLPVVGFAERVDPGELTMLAGMDCAIYKDLCTAIYQAGWRAASL